MLWASVLVREDAETEISADEINMYNVEKKERKRKKKVSPELQLSSAPVLQFVADGLGFTLKVKMLIRL